MKKLIFILGLLLLTPSVQAAKTKWVSDITECGVSYMSIYCEENQYVCGYDEILNCVKSEDVVSAKKDMVATQDIGTELGAGLVLNCYAKASSCLPWRCQSDASCDAKNQVTKCLEKGGFECGTCIPGYNDCNGNTTDGCEAKDGNIGKHARTEGCSGNVPKVVCDAGYLNCNGDGADGCEIKIDGPCQLNGKDGKYAATCSGNNPPTCNVFVQQFIPTQNETGDSIVSKVQVGESGSINIPKGEQFMVGGVPIVQTALECTENEVQMGGKCLEIPECDFLKFELGEFRCAEKPTPVEESKLYPGNCSNSQIRIGGQCQAVPQCELLRFDSANGKFLCVQIEDFSQKLEEAFVKRLSSKCKKEEVLKWTGTSFGCIGAVEAGPKKEVAKGQSSLDSDVAGPSTTTKKSQKSFFEGILDFCFGS